VTDDSAFKKQVRSRMAETGEKYTTAENAGVRRTATGDLPAPPPAAKLRPRPARILDDDA
jgi:hypothetical protein